MPDRLVLRAGGWSLDEGVVPLPELTIAAAAAANRRGDYHAARRLAAAALGTDADSEARLALSHALRYSGSAAEALALVAGRVGRRPRGRGAATRATSPRPSTW